MSGKLVTLTRKGIERAFWVCNGYAREYTRHGLGREVEFYPLYNTLIREGYKEVHNG